MWVLIAPNQKGNLSSLAGQIFCVERGKRVTVKNGGKGTRNSEEVEKGTWRQILAVRVFQNQINVGGANFRVCAVHLEGLDSGYNKEEEEDCNGEDENEYTYLTAQGRA